ncbi:MAG: DUF3467 domain-containing protein [Acidobacteria bacterium]|nr:DUF3467 domain-containing protein [Acidobacteriota bacterium]MBI3655438.1 DUF3467 domain-containing protein [Acidobacteriota bacterium]
MSTQPQNSVQINIKADDEVQRGRYSNAAQISHSGEEFTVDFFFIHSNPPFGNLLARMLLSPGHAKRLMMALQENLQRYEAAYGPIRVVPKPPEGVGFIQ